MEDAVDNFCDLMREPRWDSIAYLLELFSTRPLKEVVVWEGLKPCRLADREASKL